MPDFYTVVTDRGLQALGLATTQGQSFSLTHAVVGDGNGGVVVPNKGMTNLVNEVWRGNVAGIKVDPEDPNTLIFEFAIPADTGGFTIREVGLLDEGGKLFCIGNFPDTEKPVAADGSVRDLVVRLPLHFENAAVVNLVINAAIVLATKQDVLDHNADPQAHRLATTAATGFVRLATDEEHIAHQRKTVAATPWGVWKFIEALKSDAVDLASSLRLATSQAVKNVQDALTLHVNDAGKHVPNGGSIGECLKISDSGLEWGSVGLSATDFPSLLEESGWIQIPSDDPSKPRMILQWGTQSAVNGSGYWTYPIAFPNKCLQVYASQDRGEYACGAVPDNTNADTQKIRAKISSTYTYGADGFFLFTIGC